MLAGRQRASEAAQQAVTRDPTLGEAYTARAVLRFVFDLDWNGGDADFAQALVFNPGDVMTHWQYSRLLAALGRLPEALASATPGDATRSAVRTGLGNPGALPARQRRHRRSATVA